MLSYQKSTWIHTRAYPALDLSWSESKVKSPGWCTLHHLNKSEMKDPTRNWILSKMLMASATYTLVDSFECQHQTSYSNSFKREDLIIS